MMAKDIRFYDFDFNLLYILPAFCGGRGYSSMNARQDFNSSGSLELVFKDDELKRVIEENRDRILVTWKDFQGIVTCYRWDTEQRITGTHLNGLLKRAVIPQAEEMTGDAESMTREAITQNIPWLNLGEIKGFSNEVTYSTDKYMQADEYIQNLLATDNAGYRITADIRNKQFIFECLKTRENPIVLSEGNLNAHNFEITYMNKELAFGGWYKKEQEADSEGNKPEAVWTYITLDETKTGIYKIDRVLSATTETDAINELKAKKADYEMLLETQGIKCNVDYAIGDIVRVQHDGVTVKRLVSGVSMWSEQGEGEEPVLTEWESDENE